MAGLSWRNDQLKRKSFITTESRNLSIKASSLHPPTACGRDPPGNHHAIDVALQGRVIQAFPSFSLVDLICPSIPIPPSISTRPSASTVNALCTHRSAPPSQKQKERHHTLVLSKQREDIRPKFEGKGSSDAVFNQQRTRLCARNDERALFFQAPTHREARILELQRMNCQ
uniref:Uncharacterized protein n=1 Tax=Coccidioides posadasii RMSCC 3488 TaxID=454284 RepID=A0A0J6FUJ0_COCPO|nr:hypothetical protein CPAG_09096 [Coccidioides posadasii RMSCC 3488]